MRVDLHLSDDCVPIFSVIARWHLLPIDTRTLTIWQTRMEHGKSDVCDL